MACLVLDGRFHPVFFHEADIFLLTVSGHSEQFVVTVYEGLFRSCLVETGALVAADNVPDKAVALAQVLPDGVFPVRMRFVIAAGEVDAGYGQPPCLQGMHVRAQPACRVIPVSPGTDGLQEFLRAEFHPWTLVMMSPLPLRSHPMTKRQSAKKSMSAFRLPMHPFSSCTKKHIFIAARTSLLKTSNRPRCRS